MKLPGVHYPCWQEDTLIYIVVPGGRPVLPGRRPVNPVAAPSLSVSRFGASRPTAESPSGGAGKSVFLKVLSIRRFKVSSVKIRADDQKKSCSDVRRKKKVSTFAAF